VSLREQRNKPHIQLLRTPSSKLIGLFYLVVGFAKFTATTTLNVNQYQSQLAELACLGAFPCAKATKSDVVFGWLEASAETTPARDARDGYPTSTLINQRRNAHARVQY
jgi:hypothetical protein